MSRRKVDNGRTCGADDDDQIPGNVARRMVEDLGPEEALEAASERVAYWADVRANVEALMGKGELVTPPEPPLQGVAPERRGGPEGGGFNDFSTRIKILTELKLFDSIVARAVDGDRHAALDLWSRAGAFFENRAPLPGPLADFFALVASRVLGDLPTPDDLKAASLQEKIRGRRAKGLPVAEDEAELARLLDANRRAEWDAPRGAVGRRMAAFALRKAQTYGEAREILSRILPIPEPEDLAKALFLKKQTDGRPKTSWEEEALLGNLLCRRVWAIVRSRTVLEREAIEQVAVSFGAPHETVEKAWRKFKGAWKRDRRHLLASPEKLDLFDILLDVRPEKTE